MQTCACRKCCKWLASNSKKSTKPNSNKKARNSRCKSRNKLLTSYKQLISTGRRFGCVIAKRASATVIAMMSRTEGLI